VPIGQVAAVYDGSSNVVLFSNPGEKTQAVLSGEIRGRRPPAPVKTFFCRLSGGAEEILKGGFAERFHHAKRRSGGFAPA